MIPSASVQHRLKHFDQLLERELTLIGRVHEQNLITYTKLEKSIRRESNQIQHLRPKRISSRSVEEICSGQSDKSSSLMAHSQIVLDENRSEVLSKYHRLCFKPQHLPSIPKFNRHKRKNNDGHWIPKNAEHTTSILLNEELPEVSLPELTPMEQHIQSFLETLPEYKGVQKGFDNFAAGALYSHRVLLVMR